MTMSAFSTSMPRLSELLEGLVVLAPQFDREVRALQLDSRCVQRGDVFIATPGTHTHGREFMDAAIHAGTVAVLVEDEPAGATVHPVGVPIVRVPQLKTRVGEIAARHYGEPSAAMRVVGVTGTNGKTTISHLLAHVLGSTEATRPCGVIGTIGYGFPGQMQSATTTTPDPIALQRQLAALRASSARAVAMEVSSHAVDQSRIAGVRFAAAVFSNLTRDHLDYHGTMEAYGAAKAGLFFTPGLGAAVINLDDPFGQSLLRSLPPHLPAYGYTLAGQSPEVSGVELVRGCRVYAGIEGISLDIAWRSHQARLETRLIGSFNAANLLATFATGIALGLPWQELLCAFQGVSGVPGRMEPFRADGQAPLVLVDYAHTPDGLQQVLLSARQFCRARGRLWCVFGCGGNRDTGKRPLMGAVATRLADVVVVTSDNPRDEDPHQIIAAILAGATGLATVQVNPDRAAAIAEAVARAAPDDIVVIAGKGHEDYQEVRGERLPLSDRALVLAALRERQR